MDNKIKRIHELVDNLNQMRDVYFKTGDELVSNYEYDALFDELTELEEETGIILPNSPTINVGADESDIPGQKEAHEYPALSLPKSKQTSKLEKWAQGKPSVLSWKLDGLTLVVTYDNGKVSKVITRGDGIIGTNITHKAAGIQGIKETIDYKGHLVIRGEAYITYSDFIQYITEYDANYKNPRNLASGSLTLESIEAIKSRKVKWMPFTLVHIDENIPTWTERMEFLKSLGFNTVDYIKIDNPTEENIQNKIEDFTKIVEDGKMDIPVDGLVLCYNDHELSISGKNTGHHSTTGGFAFKWKDAEAKSNLIEIEWSCATNAITPVAIFEPVELEGTTVIRASLCNVSECERLGIGFGSEVTVIKANKIIPKVVKATKGNLIIPNCCPVCNQPTKLKISEANIKTLTCSNDNCPAKQLSKFKRFVSKHGMNIDGMSVQTIAKLISKGWVKTFSDIYNIHQYANEWAQLEGFGEKSVQNNITAIDKSKTTDFIHFMYALSIPNFGLEQIKVLKDHLDSIYMSDNTKTTEYSLLNILINLVENNYDFTVVKGFGKVLANCLTLWVKRNLIEPKTEEQFSILHTAALLTFTDKEPSESDNNDKTLNGLTFVVTGKLYQYNNRNELKDSIESRGGKVVDSISNNTSFLINNDIESTSSKNKKAKSLNVPIISEQEFIQRFGK